MAIRTLLFDMGNVLVHFSNERMCNQMAAISGVTADRIREALFERNLQIEFERGRLDEDGFHSAIQSALSTSIEFEALRVAGADIFELNRPLVPVLDRLKRDGYRLVLLSNTCVTHYEWIRREYDVLERFDDLVLSFEVGATKPDDAIFRSALEKIGCLPSECFYTDDIPAYVERGRTHGLDAEVFTDIDTLVVHLEARGVHCNGPRP
jgi:putative hydrolase of the HAD superfamily